MQKFQARKQLKLVVKNSHQDSCHEESQHANKL